MFIKVTTGAAALMGATQGESVADAFIPRGAPQTLSYGNLMPPSQGLDDNVGRLLQRLKDESEAPDFMKGSDPEDTGGSKNGKGGSRGTQKAGNGSKQSSAAGRTGVYSAGGSAGRAGAVGSTASGSGRGDGDDESGDEDKRRRRAAKELARGKDDTPAGDARSRKRSKSAERNRSKSAERNRSKSAERNRSKSAERKAPLAASAGLGHSSRPGPSGTRTRSNSRARSGSRGRSEATIRSDSRGRPRDSNSQPNRQTRPGSSTRGNSRSRSNSRNRVGSGVGSTQSREGTRVVSRGNSFTSPRAGSVSFPGSQFAPYPLGSAALGPSGRDPEDYDIHPAVDSPHLFGPTARGRRAERNSEGNEQDRTASGADRNASGVDRNASGVPFSLETVKAGAKYLKSKLLGIGKQAGPAGGQSASGSQDSRFVDEYDDQVEEVQECSFPVDEPITRRAAAARTKCEKCPPGTSSFDCQYGPTSMDQDCDQPVDETAMEADGLNYTEDLQRGDDAPDDQEDTVKKSKKSRRSKKGSTEKDSDKPSEKRSKSKDKDSAKSKNKKSDKENKPDKETTNGSGSKGDLSKSSQLDPSKDDQSARSDSSAFKKLKLKWKKHKSSKKDAGKYAVAGEDENPFAALTDGSDWDMSDAQSLGAGSQASAGSNRRTTASGTESRADVKEGKRTEGLSAASSRSSIYPTEELRAVAHETRAAEEARDAASQEARELVELRAAYAARDQDRPPRQVDETFAGRAAESVSGHGNGNGPTLSEFSTPRSLIGRETSQSGLLPRRQSSNNLAQLGDAFSAAHEGRRSQASRRLDFQSPPQLDPNGGRQIERDTGTTRAENARTAAMDFQGPGAPSSSGLGQVETLRVVDREDDTTKPKKTGSKFARTRSPFRMRRKSKERRKSSAEAGDANEGMDASETGSNGNSHYTEDDQSLYDEEDGTTLHPRYDDETWEAKYDAASLYGQESPGDRPRRGNGANRTRKPGKSTSTPDRQSTASSQYFDPQSQQDAGTPYDSVVDSDGEGGESTGPKRSGRLGKSKNRKAKSGKSKKGKSNSKTSQEEAESMDHESGQEYAQSDMEEAERDERGGYGRQDDLEKFEVESSREARGRSTALLQPSGRLPRASSLSRRDDSVTRKKQNVVFSDKVQVQLMSPVPPSNPDRGLDGARGASQSSRSSEASQTSRGAEVSQPSRGIASAVAAAESVSPVSRGSAAACQDSSSQNHGQANRGQEQANSYDLRLGSYDPWMSGPQSPWMGTRREYETSEQDLSRSPFARPVPAQSRAVPQDGVTTHARDAAQRQAQTPAHMETQAQAQAHASVPVPVPVLVPPHVQAPRQPYHAFPPSFERDANSVEVDMWAGLSGSRESRMTLDQFLASLEAREQAEADRQSAVGSSTVGGGSRFSGQNLTRLDLPAWSTDSAWPAEPVHEDVVRRVANSDGTTTFASPRATRGNKSPKSAGPSANAQPGASSMRQSETAPSVGAESPSRAPRGGVRGFFDRLREVAGEILDELADANHQVPTSPRKQPSAAGSAQAAPVSSESGPVSSGSGPSSNAGSSQASNTRPSASNSSPVNDQVIVRNADGTRTETIPHRGVSTSSTSTVPPAPGWFRNLVRLAFPHQGDAADMTATEAGRAVRRLRGESVAEAPPSVAGADPSVTGSGPNATGSDPNASSQPEPQRSTLASATRAAWRLTYRAVIGGTIAWLALNRLAEMGDDGQGTNTNRIPKSLMPQ